MPNGVIDRDSGSPIVQRSLSRIVFSVFTIALVLLGVITSLVREPHRQRNVKAVESKAPKPAKATNWALDFPRLYPRLNHGGASQSSRNCQAAWESLTAVPCHERVLDRGWDNGTWLPLMSADPLRYMPLICRPDCRKALHDAYELISTNCPTSTAFDMKGYTGTFNTTYLEAGPREAIHVLCRRNEHSCRPSNGSGYDYCLVEMTQRWGIMDGLRAGTLDGLGMFLGETERRKKEPGQLKTFTRGTGSDGGWKRKFRIQVPTLHYGPGEGETDCGSCTLQWLEKILKGWGAGQVTSPDTKQVISLPEHLHRVRKAGLRCEREEWSRMWTQAITTYVNRGQIPTDWESLASGDYGWTIQNGLSSGDRPLAEIRAARDSILANGIPQAHTPQANAVRCLNNLYDHIESIPCDIYLENPGLDYLVQEGKRMLEPYCWQVCTASISEDDRKLRFCRAKRMNEHKVVGPFITAYNEGKAIRNSMCRTAGKRNGIERFCAPVFAGMNHPQWAYESRASLTEIQSLLNNLESQPIPGAVKAAVGKESWESEWQKKELRGWLSDLEAGSCSPCIWEMVVGNGTISSAEQILRTEGDVDDLLAFADQFYDACVNRGATWMGGRPYGDDEAIWRVREFNGKVFRLIAGTTTASPNRGKWLRAEEGTTNSGWLRWKTGSLWHLRAAARRVKAQKEDRLQNLIAYEAKHASEEDAKVWEADGFWTGSWQWKGQQFDRSEQSEQPREL